MTALELLSIFEFVRVIYGWLMPDVRTDVCSWSLLGMMVAMMSLMVS